MTVMASNHNAINSGCGNAVSRRKFNSPPKSEFESPGTVAVTVKRNPKSDLSHDDLIKLLSCLEGELQAREIAIAVLKNEQVKQVLRQACRGTLDFSDPLLALQRDSSHVAEPRMNVEAMQSLSDAQKSSLERVAQARNDSQTKIMQYMEMMETQYNSVVDELDQLKAARHSSNSCSSPEQLQLQQQLETEKAARLKAEEEVKLCTDKLEQQKQHQKNIVLVLLAERNQIAAKYLQQCAKSHSLSKALSEEKARVENMAEGLEEESKKSLLMEAELERHMSNFINEKHNLKTALAREDKRYHELMSDHEKLQRECERLKNQLSEAHQVAMFQASSVSQRLSGSGAPAATGTGTRAAGGVHHSTSSTVVTKVSSTASAARSTTAGSCSLAPPRVAVRRSSSPAAAAALTSEDRIPASATLPQQPQQPQTVSMTSSGAVLSSSAIGQRAPVQSSLCSPGVPANVRSTARHTSVTCSMVSPGPAALVTSSSRSSAPPPVCRSGHFPVPAGSARRPPLGRGVPPPVPPNKPIGMAGGVFSKPSNPPPPPPPPHATSQVGVAECAAGTAGVAPPAREHADGSVVASDRTEQHADASHADSSELDCPPPLPTSPPPLCSPSSLALVDCLHSDSVNSSDFDSASSVVPAFLSHPPVSTTSTLCDNTSGGDATLSVTCLISALRCDDEDSVCRALESRPDLSEKSQDGDTAFHVAAACAGVQCLRRLLQHWLTEFMTTDMLPVLLEENSQGVSVLQLCCNRDTDDHLRALIDFCPQLRATACDLYRSGRLDEGAVSSECRQFLISAQPDSSCSRCCEVDIESSSGVVLSPQLLTSPTSSLAEYRRIAIGHLSVARSSTWCQLWESVVGLVSTHLTAVGRSVLEGHTTHCPGSGSCSCSPAGLPQLFGVTSFSSAIESIQLGSVSWRPGAASSSPSISPALALNTESAVRLTVRLDQRAESVLTTLLTAAELTNLADQVCDRDSGQLHVLYWPLSPSAAASSSPLCHVYCDNLQRALCVFTALRRPDLTGHLVVTPCGCSSLRPPSSDRIIHLHSARAPLTALSSRVCRSICGGVSEWVSAFTHSCQMAVNETSTMLPLSLSNWLSAVAMDTQLDGWLLQVWSQQLVPCVSAQLEGESLTAVLQSLQTAVIQHCPINPSDRVRVSAALSASWSHLLQPNRTTSATSTTTTTAATASRNSRSPAAATAAKKPAVRRLAPLLKKLPSVPRHKNNTSRPLP